MSWVESHAGEGSKHRTEELLHFLLSFRKGVTKTKSIIYGKNGPISTFAPPQGLTPLWICHWRGYQIPDFFQRPYVGEKQITSHHRPLWSGYVGMMSMGGDAGWFGSNTTAQCCAIFHVFLSRLTKFCQFVVYDEWTHCSRDIPISLLAIPIDCLRIEMVPLQMPHRIQCISKLWINATVIPLQSNQKHYK